MNKLIQSKHIQMIMNLKLLKIDMTLIW